MAVVAPSSSSANQQGELLTENFTRQMQGLRDLEGTELERFRQRQQDQLFRQDQMAALEQALADREVQAQNVTDDLRRQGLSDVADRFQRTTRQMSFNAARRGLQGGSADIQQQAAAQADAMRGAEDVERQAIAGGLEESLRALSRQQALAQALESEDPFTAAMNAQQIRQEQLRTQAQTGRAQTSADLENVDYAKNLGYGQALGQGLSALGRGLGAGTQAGNFDWLLFNDTQGA